MPRVLKVKSVRYENYNHSFRVAFNKLIKKILSH